MKKIIYIIGAVALLAAASCERNLDWKEDVKVPVQGLTLNFACGNLETRADGEKNYENMVRRIDYFFFAPGTDGKVAPDAEYVYKGTITAEGDDQFAIEYTETIPDGNLNKIFPNGNTEAVVFAVANYVDYYGSNPDLEPNTELPSNATTWEALHALEVGPTFFYDDHDPNFLLRWPRKMNPGCDSLSFVMVADSVVVALKTTGSYAIDAEIPLQRLASKVTVNFTYETVVEEKESGNITWVPQPSGEETRVYLSNAIEHTTLGGPLDPTDPNRPLVADSWGTATMPLGNGTRDIFEYAYDFMNKVPEVNGKKTAHYYTYPIALEEGDDNQPFIKLVLPWFGYKWVGEGPAPSTVDPTNNAWQMYKQKEVYYKIVLPRGTIDEPNYIYEYSVNVNIIGSDKEVKIIGEEYVVKDWLTKKPVSSNVATGRYISLDIPKDEYNMYVDEIDIAFVSSGTVIPIVEEIYQLNYSTATTGKDYFMQDNEVTATNALKTAKGITNEDIEGWVTIPENTSYLKIDHEMDSRMRVTNPYNQVVKNTAFDMAPYVFKVRLHLEAAGDETSFDRTVTITQYPPMFIVAQLNSNYTEGTTNDERDSHYGYVYVNNQQNSNQNNWNYTGGLYPGGSVGSANPNMYVINTSILDASLDYEIGDPRTVGVNNLNYTFASAPAIEGVLRTLRYYYPTDESDAAKNMVAPSYRIVSSYGRFGNAKTKEQAARRCAAYQEDGYPAGRWRLPTQAELEYITTLSANNFIPTLFNEGGTYWSAQTAVTVNSNGTVTPSAATTAFARCVYDEWYWGSDRLPDITVFTWGDKQR